VHSNLLGKYSSQEIPRRKRIGAEINGLPNRTEIFENAPQSSVHETTPLRQLLERAFWESAPDSKDETVRSS